MSRVTMHAGRAPRTSNRPAPLEGFAEPKDQDAKNCESDIGKARDGFDGALQAAQADCEGMNAQYATLGKKQTFTPAAR